MRATSTAALLCAAVLVGAVSVTAQTRAVRVLVVGNFGPADSAANTLPFPPLPAGSNTPAQSGWLAAASSAVRTLASRIGLQYPGASFDLPVLVNTEGRVATAVTRLAAELNRTLPFDAVVVADAFEVSVALQAVVVELFGAGGPVLVMAQTSSPDTEFSSPAVGPTSVRVVPADAVQAARMLTALEAVSWQAFSVVSTRDNYGVGFVASLQAAMAAKQQPPRVLSSPILSGWAATTRDSDDEQMIKALATIGAPGVVVAGGPGTAARILAAATRARALWGATMPAIVNLFFVFTSAAMADFPVLPVDAPRNHAVFAPQFSTAASIEAGGWVDSTAGTPDGLAFQLSYAMDAMSLVGAAAAAVGANGTSADAMSGPALFASMTTGSAVARTLFTGSLRIAAASQNRVTDGTFVLGQFSHAARALFQTIATVDSASRVGVTLNGTVPASTQSVVEVCLVASDSCADYANAAHALFALIDARARRQAPLLPVGVGINVVPLAAGTSGVRAINAVLSHAHTCDFLVGPSRTALAVAINPLVAYYGIPTLDFGSTSPALSDKVQFPYFSRTVPTENQFAMATAGAFRQFGWEAVTIITTQDTLGAGIVSEYTAAFNLQATSVEKSYMVDPNDSTNTSVAAALLDVREQLITRIVIVALAGSDEQLDNFFAAVSNLGMQQSHIFLFTDTICQYTALRPAQRLPLIGSICVLPQFNADPIVPPDTAEALQLLAAGGFNTAGCSLQYSDMYSPFAHDAANVVVDTVARMVAANGGTIRDPVNSARTIFNNGSRVVEMIRSVNLRNGLTGAVTLNANGDRSNAAFTLQIQQSDRTIQFGTWTETVGFRTDADVRIVWADNTTVIPKSSTRTLSFIAAKTAQANPGVIVVSLLGFLVTIGLFVFCCKYQLMKRQIAGVETARKPGGAAGIEMA